VLGWFAGEPLAEAADFDPGAVGILFAGSAVAAPAVGEVEALGALVAAQHPEDGLVVAGVHEAAAGLRQQAAADAGAPVLRVDVEGVDLAGAVGVGVAGGAEGGEADDLLAGEGDDRLRVGGGGGIEVVPADSLLRLQRVEDLVFDQAPVGDLPGADVDARDVKTLVRPGGSD
jgi:hypothetical protein